MRKKEHLQLFTIISSVENILQDIHKKPTYDVSIKKIANLTIYARRLFWYRLQNNYPPLFAEP